MNKDTSKIVEELQLNDTFRTFYNENKDYLITQSLGELLTQFLNEQGLTKAEVVRHSDLSEVYVYQIFSGIRKPERKKLLCVSIAMNLNLEQVQTLLKCSGYAPLYVKRPFDSVVMYGICNNLTVGQINELLFEYKLETLG
ncbi:MAG: helix-turn-helix transcriptional regulator [Clostridia bacterium]|nr:helix-turn-helix transcriptional regulator [Clostridia bacterium]